MSEAIVKALDEAATRVGGALGKDAAKAVTDLYRDAGGKLTGVIERSAATDVEHAGALKQIADQLEHNAVRTDLGDTEKAAANTALRDKLKAILDDPGKGGKPVLKRQDNDFSQDHFTPTDAKTGQPKIDKTTGDVVKVGKSHLNADGDLEPADASGKTTITQHVIGGNDPKVKGSSPYTSFAPEDGTGKIYGSHEYHLDYNKLQQDISSGKLKGVELHDPASVQNSIQGEIDKLAGGNHVTVPPGSLPNGEMTKSEKSAFAKQIAQQHGISGPAKNDLSQRINALSNTRRDNEWLVKGTIPSEYLTKIR